MDFFDAIGERDDSLGALTQLVQRVIGARAALRDLEVAAQSCDLAAASRPGVGVEVIGSRQPRDHRCFAGGRIFEDRVQPRQDVCFCRALEARCQCLEIGAHHGHHWHATARAPRQRQVSSKSTANVAAMRSRLVCSLAAAIAFALIGCTPLSLRSQNATGNPWTIPGHLRVGVRQEPDTLNPLLGQQQIDVDISMFWAGYLFAIDDRNQLEPDLATEVPTLANHGISADGKTIVYHLRRGVRWQDGAPFTASDVIFSWHAIVNPRNLTPSRTGWVLVRSVRASDPYTLIVTFFTTASNYPYSIVPAHLLARYPDINRVAYNTKPIGTGPFMVADYEPGNLIHFVANPRYWRGPPGLKDVVVRIVPNDNTLATLIRTHEIDMYYRAPHTVSRTLRGEPGVRVISSPFTRFEDLGFNLRSPFVGDVRVRRALAYATDKAALVAKVTTGADIIADSDQPPYVWAHVTPARAYPYDLTAAGRLLDEAGWRLGPDGVRRKNGVALELDFAGIAGDAVSIVTRQYLQAAWRSIGVVANIRSYPTDILYAPLASGGIENSGKFDVVLESFGNGADPDDSVLFECRWQPPAGENAYRFCNGEVDALEEHALSTNDQKTRFADYARIQNILAEQLPIYTLYFERYDYAVNTDLRNFRPAHVGSPFWNVWEWRI